MSPERLLKHFDQICETPDAILRLRQFIFDLAVRGKLAERNSTDEPVSSLLNRIDHSVKHLSKFKKIKSQDAPNPITADEIPFDVPNHWEWVRLTSIGVLSGGMTPSKNREAYWGGEINWFSPKDIKSDELIESELKITTEGLTETGLQLYPPGCLFMVARSGILKRTFPVAVNRVPAAANQDLKVLNPFVAGLGRYIQIMFQGMTSYILSALVKTGTTVQSLKYEQFESQPIPLPPLAEQHRIVAKVDELMALCDKLEAAQAKREKRRDRLVAATLHGLNKGDASPASGTPPTFKDSARFYLNHLPRLTTRPEHIHKLRQTILNLAIRGKLAPQRQGNQPVSDLLEKINAEREELIKKGMLKRKETILDLSQPSSLFPIPDKWEWVRLQEIFLMIADGDHQPPPRAQTGIPFLVIGNVRNRKIEFGADLRFVPDDYYSGIDESRLPRKGKILYTLVGSYGIPILLTDELKFCVQRHIGVLTPSKYLNGKYLALLLDSQLVFNQATACATGIAQKTVPLSGLRRIKVPLPPIAEQNRIAAKVDELLALCDELEAGIATTTATRFKLLEATLQDALAF